MADILAELFDQFGPEEQAQIRAAEAQAEAALAQGASGVENRLRAPASLLEREWVLQPQDESKAGAACILFISYCQVLRGRTDLVRTDAVQEFMRQLGEIAEAVLKKFGQREGQDAIARLRKTAEELIWREHARAISVEAAGVRAAMRSSHSDKNIETPEFWRARRCEFADLLKRQQLTLKQGTDLLWLKAYCRFNRENSVGSSVVGGLDGAFRSEFGDVATHAAYGISCPPGVEPVKYWIDSLGHDLLESPEPTIKREAIGGDWGAIIQGLLESSVGYCSRLAEMAQRQARDRKTPPPKVGEKATPSSPGGGISRLDGPAVGESSSEQGAVSACDSEQRSGEDLVSHQSDRPPAQVIIIADPVSRSPVVPTPTILPQREFLERRHQLPDAPDEVKREFRLLAQEAVIIVTRGSTFPLRGVDDWLDRLLAEGDFAEGNMEQLVVASKDHLRRMRVYELGIGHNEQAEDCGAVASAFADLQSRFFGQVPSLGNDVIAESNSRQGNSEMTKRAHSRQAVVMPILKKKRWKRGKWATVAAVGKNSVYEYLEGKRNLSEENRTAMAEALDLTPEQLPE